MVSVSASIWALAAKAAAPRRLNGGILGLAATCCSKLPFVAVIASIPRNRHSSQGAPAGGFVACQALASLVPSAGSSFIAQASLLLLLLLHHRRYTLPIDLP